MSSFFPPPNRITHKSQAGSSLILVLFALSMLVLEISVMGLSLSRSLGSEGVLLTQNVAARRGLETAFTRLENSLYNYLTTGTQTAADTAFASGGGSAISNATVTATNPETAATDNTPVKISAWVQARRGYYYNIRATAVSGDVSLTSNRWVMMKPCSSAGLTTVLSGRPNPDQSVVDQLAGRFFIAERNDPANWYTWSSSTGLSTLVSNITGGGCMTLDSLTGRVFYAQSDSNSNVYTWLSSTGLSTLLTHKYYPACQRWGGIVISPSTGRAFINVIDGSYYTWQASTGLSLMGSGLNIPTLGSNYVIKSSTDQIYWGANNNVHTWSSTTGLSTLFTTSNNILINSIDQATGRIFAGENTNPGNAYVWTSSSGLSTLLSGRPTPNQSAVDPLTGKFFIAENNDPANLYTWSSSSGLSTLLASRPGTDCMAVDSLSGRLFFAEGSAGSGNVYTWLSSTGLSTLLSGKFYPACQRWSGVGTLSLSSGREFLNIIDGSYYTWLNSTGLTLMVSGIASPTFGSNYVIQTPADQIFWGANSAAFTWSSTTGLSTLFTTSNNVIINSIDQATGRIFAGESTDPGNAYMYTPSTCGNKPY